MINQLEKNSEEFNFYCEEYLKEYEGQILAFDFAGFNWFKKGLKIDEY